MAGESVRLSCSSAPSQPAASLHWLIQQRDKIKDPDTETVVEQLEDGTFISSLKINIEMPGQGSDLVAECVATTGVFKQDFRVYKHVVELLSKCCHILFLELCTWAVTISSMPCLLSSTHGQTVLVEARMDMLTGVCGAGTDQR